LDEPEGLPRLHPEAALTKGAKRIAERNFFDAVRERVNPLVLALPRFSRPRGQ
jgi:hypothetical protein